MSCQRRGGLSLRSTRVTPWRETPARQLSEQRSKRSACVSATVQGGEANGLPHRLFSDPFTSQAGRGEAGSARPYSSSLYHLPCEKALGCSPSTRVLCPSSPRWDRRSGHPAISCSIPSDRGRGERSICRPSGPAALP